MKMYELTGMYLELMNLLESGEMTEEELKDTFEALDGDIEDKAENTAKVIKSVEGQIDVIKAEEKRLKDRRTALENNVKRIKSNLEYLMLAMDKKKIKTPLFTLSVQKNAPSVVIHDESYLALPKYKYLYKQQEPVLDRKLLLEKLKAGEEIKGVTLQQTESLRIR